MKRFVSILMRLVIAAVLVSMSVPSTVMSASAPISVYLPVVLNNWSPVTITWWHITTIDPGRALWQTLANQYMAAHPNVNIEISVMDNETFKTTLAAAMEAGTPPDIFQSWGGGTLNQQAKAGMLKDITADLDANGSAWRESFGAGPLGLYAYQGKNHGVPWDMGMVGFWYNKDLFAQAGITNTPTTWTEFKADVSKLKTAGITPIALGAGDKWPTAFYWEYLATRIGGQAAFEAAYDRTGAFTDAPFVQAGEKLQELVALNAFQDEFLSATSGDESTIMGNGQAAMDLMGQWGPGSFGDGIRSKLGFFPFPVVEAGSGNPGDVIGGGNGFAIGKNAPPEAIDFVKFLTSVDSEIQLAAAGIAIPTVKGAEVGLTDPLMIIVQQTFTAAPYFQLYYDQYLPPAMGSVVNDSVYGILAGTLTPLQAAQAIENSAEAEIK
jgi:raffinose/stachyose/melibiose transport system substrate-binding protein